MLRGLVFLAAGATALAPGIAAGSASLLHDPGLSSLAIECRADATHAVMTCNLADLAPIAGAASRPGATVDLTTLRRLLPDPMVVVRTSDGVLVARRVVLEPAPDGDVQMVFDLPPVTSERITVEVPLLARLPRGHRQYTTITDARGQRRAVRLLAANDPRLEADLRADAGGWMTTAGSFSALGIEHIVTGYDHLLFLLALLLACPSLLAAAKVITAFTVAHSFTLAAATLGWVTLPPTMVEPFIAGSVMFVAGDNLWRAWRRRGAPVPERSPERWPLTFAFGLVHGLGFAGALADAGLGTAHAGIALPLASFNLGVEAGQIALAAVAWPLLRAVQRLPVWGTRMASLASLSIVVAGGVWLWERTLG